VRIRDGAGGIGGGWFGESVVKKVGDGSETFFWTDTWIDNTPLCVRFQRLFDLAVSRSSTVAWLFYLGWGTRGEAWEWRRPLWVLEEERLENIVTLYFTIFSCRLSLRISGFGGLIMTEVTQSWVFISY
jgi:hypothetical protein